MLISFIAACMHSDVLIVHFRGMQLDHLILQAIRVISMNLEYQSKRQGNDKCNAYLSKGMRNSPNPQTHWASGLRKLLEPNHFYRDLEENRSCKARACFSRTKSQITFSSRVMSAQILGTQTKGKEDTVDIRA